MSEQSDSIVDNDMNGADAEPSEILDEDRMNADPLEGGMDTAEDYSRTVKLGSLANDEDQDTLAYRIPQEEPDVAAEEQLDVPIAERPVLDLDESVDDPANSVDGVGGAVIVDPLAGDGATEAELPVDGDVELTSPDDGTEPTGLASDDEFGQVAPMHQESANEGAEQQALRVEQEN